MSSHRLSCPGHRSINELGVGTAAEKGHRDVIRMLVFSIRWRSPMSAIGGHYRFERTSAVLWDRRLSPGRESLLWSWCASPAPLPWWRGLVSYAVRVSALGK